MVYNQIQDKNQKGLIQALQRPLFPGLILHYIVSLGLIVPFFSQITAVSLLTQTFLSFNQQNELLNVTKRL